MRLVRLPLLWLSRKFRMPLTGPINLTVSLLYSCNSRCLTCNVWKKKTDNLTVDEYEKIFAGIGKGPWEVIFTGGEPFLRKDIVEICRAAVHHMQVPILIIPTNGLLTERIVEKVRAILDALPQTKLVINMSIDEISEADDRIRGVPGAYDKAIETFSRLREIKSDRLELKVHTVISRHNVRRIAAIYDELQRRLGPVEWISEIAEERVELDTIGADITPSADDYELAIDEVIKQFRHERQSKLSRLTQAFRIEYYELVKRILREKRRVVPCYAAYASCQIAPDGDVWACCVGAESLGNLRENGYDFRSLWRGNAARRIRESIRKGECYCPLANAAYTNLLLHFPSLVKAAGRYLRNG